MSLCLLELPEEVAFNQLPAERQANIEIVGSAYASLIGKKAYVSMAVTTGKRFYDTLIRYGVSAITELEVKSPGALRGEIILPNIEDGLEFARHISPEIASQLIVPGVFEARRQRWSQEEYMILWFRVLSQMAEIYMTADWEYSNGGAKEFTRAMMIRYGLIKGAPAGMKIFDHNRQPLTIEEGASRLAAAIKYLDGHGFDTEPLKNGVWQLAAMSATLPTLRTNFSGEAEQLIQQELFGNTSVWSAARSAGHPKNFVFAGI